MECLYIFTQISSAAASKSCACKVLSSYDAEEPRKSENDFEAAAYGVHREGTRVHSTKYAVYDSNFWLDMLCDIDLLRSL